LYDYFYSKHTAAEPAIPAAHLCAFTARQYEYEQEHDETEFRAFTAAEPAIPAAHDESADDEDDSIH